jgi:hypothetical protein
MATISPGLGLLLSSLIGFGGSALSASGQQHAKPYTGAADPQKLLLDAMGQNKGMGQALVDKARKGVQLRTTVQSPAGFAQDPAIANPDLLKFPGLDIGDIFGAPAKPAVPAQVSPALDGVRPHPGPGLGRIDDSMPNGGGAGGGSVDGRPGGPHGLDILRYMADPIGSTISDVSKKVRRKSTVGTDTEGEGGK